MSEDDEMVVQRPQLTVSNTDHRSVEQPRHEHLTQQFSMLTKRPFTSISISIHIEDGLARREAHEAQVAALQVQVGAHRAAIGAEQAARG